mgnify:CR=1 FL=1
MGFSIKRLFKSRETPEPEKVTTIEITDQQVRDAAAEVCLRELAFWTCIGKIANALTKCEFRTFYEGREIFGDEYYTWNYEPNRNQNKAEFLSKAIEKLYRENELLIVESYDGQLLVANSFEATHNTLYGDTYRNVLVDDYQFSRTFHSADVLHWKLNNRNVNKIINGLYSSYSKLIDYSAQSYLKSRGSRGILNISTMAQSEKLFEEKLKKLMNEYFKSFFNSSNAVKMPAGPAPIIKISHFMLFSSSILFILSILSLRFSIKICIFLRKHAFVLLSFFLFLKIK